MSIIVRFRRRIHLVDTTHSLNISAGVWKPSVLCSFSFSCLAAELSWSRERPERFMPFGMYCLSGPFVFCQRPMDTFWELLRRRRERSSYSERSVRRSLTPAIT